MNLLNAFIDVEKYTIGDLQRIVNNSTHSKKNRTFHNLSSPVQITTSLDVFQSPLYKQRQLQKFHKKCEFHQKSNNSGYFTSIYLDSFNKDKQNSIKEYKKKIANQIKSDNKQLLSILQKKNQIQLQQLKQKIKAFNSNHNKKIKTLVKSKYILHSSKPKQFFNKSRFHNTEYQNSINNKFNDSDAVSITRKSNKFDIISQYLSDPNYKFNTLIKFLVKIGYDFTERVDLKMILNLFQNLYQMYCVKKKKQNLSDYFKKQCLRKFSIRQTEISKIILAWNKIVIEKSNKTYAKKKSNVSPQDFLPSDEIKDKLFSRTYVSSVSRRSSLFSIYSLQEFFQFEDAKIHQFAHAEREDIIFGLEHIENELKQQYEKSKTTKIVPEYIIQMKTSNFVSKMIKTIEKSNTLNVEQIHERSEILYDGLKVIHRYEDEMINQYNNEEIHYTVKHRKAYKNLKNMIGNLGKVTYNNIFAEDSTTIKQYKDSNILKNQSQDRKIQNLLIRKQKKKNQDQQKNIIVQEESEDQDDQDHQDENENYPLITNSKRKRNLRNNKTQTHAVVSIIQNNINSNFKIPQTKDFQTQKKQQARFKSPLVKLYRLKLNLILEQINLKLISKNLSQFIINQSDNNIIRRKKIARLKKYLEAYPEFSDQVLLRNIGLYQEHDLMTKQAKYDSIYSVEFIQSKQEDKILMKNIMNSVETSKSSISKLGPQIKLSESITSDEDFSQSESEKSTKKKQKNAEIQEKDKKKQNIQNLQNFQFFEQKLKNSDNRVQDNQDCLIQKSLKNIYQVNEQFMFSKSQKKIKSRFHLTKKMQNIDKIKQILAKLKKTKPEVFDFLLNYKFQY